MLLRNKTVPSRPTAGAELAFPPHLWTEASLSYVQCFLYLLQQISLFFIFPGWIPSRQTLYDFVLEPFSIKDITGTISENLEQDLRIIRWQWYININFLIFVLVYELHRRISLFVRNTYWGIWGREWSHPPMFWKKEFSTARVTFIRFYCFKIMGDMQSYTKKNEKLMIY